MMRNLISVAAISLISLSSKVFGERDDEEIEEDDDALRGGENTH